MSEARRCQGWRRYGGAFSFGPIKWVQCKERATVMLCFERDGKTETLPACPKCWQECIDTGLKILSAKPIPRVNRKVVEHE